MLGSKIFVNLPLEFIVSVDLVRHRSKQSIQVWRGTVPIKRLVESPSSVRAPRAWNSRVNVRQNVARIFSSLA
jgi:hypothetical protein